MELLRDVIDPELGVDVVSLGLIYGVEVNGRTVAVLATTTSPACPLGDYISSEIERVLLDSGAADRVAVEITHSFGLSAFGSLANDQPRFDRAADLGIDAIYTDHLDLPRSVTA